MKNDCNIIQDLLPLYVENICHWKSRVQVEMHLEACESCAHQLKLMQETYDNTAAQSDTHQTTAARAAWKKARRKSLLKGVTLGLAILLLLSAILFLPCSKPVIVATARNNADRIATFSQRALSAGVKRIQEIDGYQIDTLPDSNCVYFRRLSLFRATGFFYAPDDAPVAAFAEEITLHPTPDGWTGTGQYGQLHIQRIADNLFWYEIHF